jgi:lipoate-protein ligase B
MDNVIKQTVLFQDMGWMEYQEAWDYQEALLKENVRIKGVLRDLQNGTSRSVDGTSGSGAGAYQENTRTYAAAPVTYPQNTGTSTAKHGTSAEKPGTYAPDHVTTAPEHGSSQGSSVPSGQYTHIQDPLPGDTRGIAHTINPHVRINDPDARENGGHVPDVDAKVPGVGAEVPDVGAEVRVPDTKNYLLFVEHPPVYTLGKSGSIENILISEEDRLAKGISFYHTNRGGDITFHGPEQIVGYPILDLEKFYTDIGKYLRNLEDVIIATMADYGLKGERSPGETGVWMDAAVPGRERKICAMGIRCSRWVTMHGFAFNVNTDLSYFDYIIPCGIQNKKVTSMERELGKKLDVAEVKEKLKVNFGKIFGVELVKNL